MEPKFAPSYVFQRENITSVLSTIFRFNYLANNHKMLLQFN